MNDMTQIIETDFETMYNINSKTLTYMNIISLLVLQRR